MYSPNKQSLIDNAVKHYLELSIERDNKLLFLTGASYHDTVPYKVTEQQVSELNKRIRRVATRIMNYYDNGAYIIAPSVLTCLKAEAY